MCHTLSLDVLTSYLLQIFFLKDVLLLRDMYAICDIFDMLELHKTAYIGNFPCGNLFSSNLSHLRMGLDFCTTSY